MIRWAQMRLLALSSREGLWVKSQVNYFWKKNNNLMFRIASHALFTGMKQLSCELLAKKTLRSCRSKGASERNRVEPRKYTDDDDDNNIFVSLAICKPCKMWYSSPIHCTAYRMMCVYKYIANLYVYFVVCCSAVMWSARSILNASIECNTDDRPIE